jgi:hypothetical protein
MLRASWSRNPLAFPSCFERDRQVASTIPAEDAFGYWEGIFKQDAERRQDQEEAEASGRVMGDTYARFGYQLVALLKASFEERVNFVVEHLSAE